MILLYSPRDRHDFSRMRRTVLPREDVGSLSMGDTVFSMVTLNILGARAFVTTIDRGAAKAWVKLGRASWCTRDAFIAATRMLT